LADSYRKEIKILVPQLESIDETDFYGNVLDGKNKKYMRKIKKC